MRPGTGNRLRTGHVPPAPAGTATRLTTGLRQRTAFQGGVPSATLNADLRIEDRPITQQGLEGLKTGVKGPRRQIEDRSYFIGVLRGKINEVSAELASIAAQHEEAEKENQSYVQYEQMAEALAAEIKGLQGELGDYNTLVDKATIGHDISSIELDWEDVKMANERAELGLERLFEERKKKESQLKSLEMERIAEGVVEDMTDEQKSAYLKLKDLSQHLLKQLEMGQKELEELSAKRRELELDISSSQVKQEAMRILGQLREVEAKRDQLLAAEASQEDPQVERERLLAKIKEDNRETANMDREIRELNEKIREDESAVGQMSAELEDIHSERNQKFWELKRREQQMDTFLNSFSTAKAEENEAAGVLEDQIVKSLEKASQYIVSTNQTNEFTAGDRQNIDTNQLADQLTFKSKELAKSASTADSLDGERLRLQRDLQKVDQLEGKISQELQTLKKSITKMEAEIKRFSDLESVREVTEEKRVFLTREQERLALARNQLSEMNQSLSAEYSDAQLQLSSQDMHIQLSALEKRLVQHEQTTHSLREAIANKRSLTDCAPLAEKARELVRAYNETLKASLGTRISL
ncbi:unnamed protein product [Mesocestoides corti]|uniref:Intraflagellar transport protein 74 homolog n=1 Tax=Mesocestoides corti TaxID=53468 RepID=A0A0R3U3T9_MESCO|nr:unnamed protein product [Mesocestoides corti]